MKFKVGDKARVVANKPNHSFKIGAIVTVINCIKGENSNFYQCTDNISKFYWCYHEEDLNPIESIIIEPNTGIKDFAIQVVKYLEDHYGDHNNKAFLEVVNDKLK